MKIQHWRLVRSLMERLLHVDLNKQLQLENEYLREENLVLKPQLEKLGKRLRLCDAERIRLAEKAIALGKRLYAVVTIVRPETLLAWHRKLVSQKFDGSKQREYPGRPSVKQNIEAELLKIARQNPAWGYRRIAGALKNLGFKISDSSVANIMRRNALPPSGTRQNHGTSWREFIQLHCHLIWASDFFTVEAWTVLLRFMPRLRVKSAVKSNRVGKRSTLALCFGDQTKTIKELQCRPHYFKIHRKSVDFNIRSLNIAKKC